MKMAEEKKANKLDISNLQEALGELSAIDFMNAEKACRLSGDTFPEISYSSTFRARLVAKALGVDFAEVKNMPISDFNTAVGMVMVVLNESLANQVIQHNN